MPNRFDFNNLLFDFSVRVETLLPKGVCPLLAKYAKCTICNDTRTDMNEMIPRDQHGRTHGVQVSADNLCITLDTQRPRYQINPLGACEAELEREQSFAYLRQQTCIDDTWYGSFHCIRMNKNSGAHTKMRAKTKSHRNSKCISTMKSSWLKQLFDTINKSWAC